MNQTRDILNALDVLSAHHMMPIQEHIEVVEELDKIIVTLTRENGVLRYKCIANNIDLEDLK